MGSFTDREGHGCDLGRSRTLEEHLHLRFLRRATRQAHRLLRRGPEPARRPLPPRERPRLREDEGLTRYRSPRKLGLLRRIRRNLPGHARLPERSLRPGSDLLPGLEGWRGRFGCSENLREELRQERPPDAGYGTDDPRQRRNTKDRLRSP